MALPQVTERPVRVYVVAAMVLIALNVLDVVVTHAALAAGATEMNPVARWFIEHAVLAYGIKFAVPALVLALAFTRQARRRIDEAHVAAIWMVVGIYLMTVVVNTLTLARSA